MVNSQPIKVGILALQGAFDLHRQTLDVISGKSGQTISIVEVRKPQDVEGIDGIIFPGGESTVLKKLLDSSGLGLTLKELISEGLPNFGTCAGLILQADYFNCIDCSIERNAYGTQNDSFQTEINFNGQNVDVFFIRAPKISKMGNGVEAVAKLDEDPVGMRQDNSIGITCHPEVANTYAIHEFFVSLINERVKSIDN